MLWERSLKVSPSPSRVKPPSILLASSNCRRLVTNIAHILDATAVSQLEREIHRHVIGLFQLGEEHLEFARSVLPRQWRQRTSRFYYAALNIKRSLTLEDSGAFSTDSSDHKNIGDLPSGFPLANTFGTRLENLRDDRNLADYSHLSGPNELIISTSDVEPFVVSFAAAARQHLKGRGVRL